MHDSLESYIPVELHRTFLNPKNQEVFGTSVKSMRIVEKLREGQPGDVSQHESRAVIVRTTGFVAQTSGTDMTPPRKKKRDMDKVSDNFVSIAC